MRDLNFENLNPEASIGNSASIWNYLELASIHPELFISGELGG
jgi:hypothetical protein